MPGRVNGIEEFPGTCSDTHFFPKKLLSIPGSRDRTYKPDRPDGTANVQEPPRYGCPLLRAGQCRPLA